MTRTPTPLALHGVVPHRRKVGLGVIGFSPARSWNFAVRRSCRRARAEAFSRGGGGVKTCSRSTKRPRKTVAYGRLLASR